MRVVLWGLVVGSSVVIAVVALAGLARSRPRSNPSPAGELDPTETASIGATLESIGHAHADAQNRRLAALVEQLIDRHVPARAVEVVPGRAEARIRFADGTTMRARGAGDGALGLLAAVMPEGSVTPISCRCEADGVHILFDRTARQVIGAPRPLSVRVVGIDQPD